MVKFVSVMHGKIKFILLMIVLLSIAGCYAAWYFNHSVFDAERILANSKLKDRSFKGEVVDVWAQDKKLHAYLMREHSIPLVAISFGFDKAGKAYETKQGVVLLVESILLDGAGRFSRKELRDLMKEKGIKLSVSADEDRLSFSLSFVKKFEKDALEILKAVLYDSHFDKKDIELARRQLAMLRKQQAENPQYQLSKLVDDKFYAPHPYAKENIPNDDILADVSVDDMRDYLKNFMAKNTLKIGIAGDMDKAESEAFLTQAFSQLTDEASEHTLLQFSPQWDVAPAREKSSVSAQSLVLFKTSGIARLDADFYPLMIADYIFGGSGLSSRLSMAVRENEGLTYGIYSFLSNSDVGDFWQIYFSSTPDNTQKIFDLIEKEYQSFYQDGVTSQELDMAKSSLLSSFNLRFSSLAVIAEMLEQMQVQNLGIDFLKNRQAQVKQVTLEQVNRAIRKHFPKTLVNQGEVRLFEVVGMKNL